MEDTRIQEAAAILHRNWLQGTRIAGLPESCRPATRRDGYAVQAALATLSGEGMAQAVAGWKIAATSAAGQKHIGVSGPLAGPLLAGRVHEDGAGVALGDNVMKVAEAEFVFRMGCDLPPRGEAYGVDEVLAAVAGLHPGIEIPDSRYADFVHAGEAQLVADLACACRFVLGPEAGTDWRRIDLAAHPVRLFNHGREIASGLGAQVLGDPRTALAWLANELSQLGIGLRRGQIVTTGTCIVPAAIAPGDDLLADFGTLGRVGARILA